MAEWLNATDCNFVPITVRRFKSFSPQEKEEKRRRKKEMRKESQEKKVNRTRVKERRKNKKKKNQGKAKKGNKRGEGRRTRRRKRVKTRKRNLPHYVRGVPRRAGRTLEKARRKVYGVGRGKAREICRACGRRPRVRVGNLETEQVQLREGWMMENVRGSSDRRRVEHEAVQRHLKLGTVRGMNLRRGLPVRGQRTSTNGMTARKLNKTRGRKVRQ